jgi:hypothetical protein
MSHSDFDFTAPMKPFYEDVMKTVVQQDDFRGIGMHGLQEHGPHGLHRQTSIGIGEDRTLNFRELVPSIASFEPVDHFDRFEPPMPEMAPLPMPMYEPPEMSFQPAPSFDPGPCMMNEAQAAFWGPAPIMNEAQQAFYEPPPMNCPY